MKSYVVIGMGRFGSEVARRLYELGCEVLAIDSHAELIQPMGDCVTQAVVADARDKEVLRALGVKDFDCAVVAIGGSLSDSVLATMNLKELGVGHIVCKAHDDTHRQVLMKLGADQVVIPEQENALRLARSLSSFNVLDYIELSDDYGIIDVPAPAGWVAQTLRDLNVRAAYSVNILAIKHDGKINVSPTADYCISQGDVLVVLGDTEALKALRKL